MHPNGVLQEVLSFGTLVVIHPGENVHPVLGLVAHVQPFACGQIFGT